MGREPDVTVENDDSLNLYQDWDGPPRVIISDGAYGTGSFPSDPPSPTDLTDWYEPHIEAWTEQSDLGTVLWLWNTEIGWAEIHPLLKEYGWEYRGANIWNKGIQHIAGNSNTKTMRKFPQVTEVCVQYQRSGEKILPEEYESVRDWLRTEWKRAGLAFDEANEACGVDEAASRKYFATDWQWYFPPPEKFQQLKEYANEHGDPEGKPYLSLDSVEAESEHELAESSGIEHRAKFDLPSGVTNVWNHPQVSHDERLQQGDETIHLNQKPLKLMKRIIKATTERGDMVWEPFGGLATGAVAAKQLGRGCRCAEVVEEYYAVAAERIESSSVRPRERDTAQTGLETFTQ